VFQNIADPPRKVLTTYLHKKTAQDKNPARLNVRDGRRLAWPRQSNLVGRASRVPRRHLFLGYF
jgi:hypothetical protein